MEEEKEVFEANQEANLDEIERFLASKAAEERLLFKAVRKLPSKNRNYGANQFEIIEEEPLI